MIKAPEFNFKKVFLGSFLIALFIIALFILLLNRNNIFKTKEAEAAIDDNVLGFAWSENIGWISMNDTDVGAGNYGVNIGASGGISGWSWSENIGWICWGGSCSDYGITPEGIAPYAEVNSATAEISGWAKIISIDGDDGWISLRRWDIDDPLYGVKVCLEETCNYTDAAGNPAVASLGDWYYWAWSPAVGWIDFSGVNTSWSKTTPFSEADLTVFNAQGIFEPLCCNGDPICESCINDPLNCQYEDVKDVDVYCDGGEAGDDLRGLHLHTIRFALSGFDEQFNGGVVDCRINIPGLCQNTSPYNVDDPVPQKITCWDNNQCGSYCVGGTNNNKLCESDVECPSGSCSYYEGPCEDNAAPVSEIILNGVIENGQADFAYTLDGDLDYSALEGIAIDKRLPWRLEGCKFSQDEEYLPIYYNWTDNNEDCNNGEDDDADGRVDAEDSDCRRPLILVHPNTWQVRGSSEADAVSAFDCWLEKEHRYFFNEERCNYSGDYDFSIRIKNDREDVEWDCGDGIDNDGDGLVDCDDSRDCSGIAVECIDHKKLVE